MMNAGSNPGAIVTMTNVVAIASGGIENRGVRNLNYPPMTVTLNRCTAAGSTSSLVMNDIDGYTINVGASQLAGPVGGRTLTCVASYTATSSPSTRTASRPGPDLEEPHRYVIV